MADTAPPDAPRLAARAVHGDRRPPRRRGLRARRRPPPAGSTPGSVGLARLLHQRRRGRRRLADRSAGARGAARVGAAGRGGGRRLRGVTFLHQPDGALANDLALREQLVREIRTFRPDAVLAVDPETLFHGDGGVNHIDHRAAGHRRGRRRLPGGPQRDGVPVARPRRPRAAQGPAPVPVLVGPADRLGRRQRDARSQDRRAARPCQPDPQARASSRRGSASGRARRASAIGVEAAEAFRVIVIEEDDEADEAAATDGSAGQPRPRAEA